MSKANQFNEARFTLGDALPPGPRFSELARCSHCRYAAPSTPPYLECRFASPSHIEAGGARWPRTGPDHWCGAFGPNAPLHADDALVMAYRAALAHQAALDAMQAKRQGPGRKVIHVKKA